MLTVHVNSKYDYCINDSNYILNNDQNIFISIITKRALNIIKQTYFFC